MIQGERLVFIGGLHRSGTTLLGRLLAEHPEIGGFRNTGAPEDEGQHLQSVFPPALAFGGPGRFAFAESARMTEAPEAPDHRRRLSEQWGPYWDLTRRYLVEKSPPNLIRMRYLQSVFPGCRHVLMLRHPLVVALATQKWSRTSCDELLRHWFHAYDIAVEDAGSIDRLLAVAYEELTARPRATLGRIFDWLGLEASVVSSRAVESSNAAYLDKWLHDCHGDAVKRAQAASLEERYEPAMNRYGYSLRDLERADDPSRLLPTLATRG